MRHDKDFELLEKHNRIKKLLLEEERNVKKLEDTRRKALDFENQIIQGYRRRNRDSSRNNEYIYNTESNMISERIAEIRRSREVSPKEAAQRIYEMKMEAA